MKNYTINHFKKDYPTDEACLDRIFKLRYKELKSCPKCKVETTFRRVATRTCYQCIKCYHQIHPTAGTIFEKSTTSLTLWFYTMYLFSQSKNGVSAKEIERQFRNRKTSALTEVFYILMMGGCSWRTLWT